ncbi:transporter substrate-binding domain-containing protein [Candidatus Dependentiae bacterium]|nr:transporter substrate-binding domain-containing protein [Candidatus Dependentiae bacterium]
MNFLDIKKLFFPFLTLSLMVFFSIYTIFFSENEQREDNEHTLKVGLNSGYPPYEMLNQKGELEGFDIDIANALGKKLGKKVFIKDMAFDALIMELQQGKLDLIISGMSITPQRLEKISMIHYQGQPLTELSLIFWKTIPQGISSLSDIKNYPNAFICVQAGSLQEAAMLFYPTIQLRYLDVPQMPIDLMYGKSFAALLENPAADDIALKQPDIKVVRVKLPPEMQAQGNGIAIHKKQTALTQQVTQAIEELKQDGTITTLEKKWFKESKNVTQ